MSRGSRIGRTLLAITSALVLIAVLIGAYTQRVQDQLEGNITVVDVSEQTGRDVEPTAPLVVVDEETGTFEPLNVLLLGSDSREGKGNKGYGNASDIGGARSDTTILLHVAGDRKSAIAVSIPRDLVITLPKCKKKGQPTGGYEGRFNEAIELGGPGCTIKAVEQLSGLEINNFMMVDFGGFKRIVDAIGGVEICVQEDVNDPMSGLQLDKGKHVLQGEEALAFVRARKTLGDGSDTSRIRRQQAFLASLIRGVLSIGTLLNPASLMGVLDAATKSLTADPQMADLDNLKELALSAKDLRPSDVTFVTLPWIGNSDGATVSVNSKRAAPIWEAIRNDTAWPPRGEEGAPILKTVPSEIRVNVLNGTGVKGAGKKAAKMLRDEGFIVTGVGNADRDDYTETVVQFDPDWDVSARTLIYATSATEEKVKGQGQEMNLIIGPDFAEVKPVKIQKIAQDYTAQINTADETFCAS